MLGSWYYYSTAIFVVALYSKINIGVRHVLPIYIALSIAAAIGIVELVEKSSRAQWAAWFLGHGWKSG